MNVLLVKLHCSIAIRYEQFKFKVSMIFYVLAIFGILTTPVWSYASGANEKACNGLAPKHPSITKQTSTAPYDLIVKDEYKPGETITLTLKAKNNEDIKGFLVSASSGKFIAGKNSKTLTCKNQADSITHKKIDGDLNSVTFSLQTPYNAVEDIIFRATVAKSYDVFWVDAIKKRVKLI